MKPSEMPTRLNPHRATLRCIIIKLPKAKGKEKNFNTAKGRSYIQVKLHKTVSRFLNKKRVGWHIQNIKRQKLLTKNSILSKALLQKWRMSFLNKNKKPNAKGGYHQYACLTRLSGRKTMLINIIKTLKSGIKLTSDIKYIV